MGDKYLEISTWRDLGALKGVIYPETVGRPFLFLAKIFVFAYLGGDGLVRRLALSVCSKSFLWVGFRAPRLNPFGAPRSLPILTSSKFVPQKGFQFVVVKALRDDACYDRGRKYRVFFFSERWGSLPKIVGFFFFFFFL